MSFFVPCQTCFIKSLLAVCSNDSNIDAVFIVLPGISPNAVEKIVSKVHSATTKEIASVSSMRPKKKKVLLEVLESLPVYPTLTKIDTFYRQKIKDTEEQLENMKEQYTKSRKAAQLFWEHVRADIRSKEKVTGIPTLPNHRRKPHSKTRISKKRLS